MPDHDHGDIFDSLVDAVDFSEHEGKPPFIKWAGILHDGARALCNLLAAGEAPVENSSAVADAAERFFDEFLAPIDWPVNDFFEGFLKSQLRGFIRPAVYQLADYLEGPHNP